MVLIPIDYAIEALKFLDWDSREALRLVCKTFDRLFTANFAEFSPSIQGIMLRIFVSEDTIGCLLSYGKAKLPDYFSTFNCTNYEPREGQRDLLIYKGLLD